MRRINESRAGWNTLIAFSLIPLSGFAMDVFIPSLPDMAAKLHASPSAIQLTLSIFMISYGISQLVVGGLIDSYGRYLPGLASMLVFSASSFVIAYTDNLQLIYWMRALQGLAVAIIVISKRAYFCRSVYGRAVEKVHKSIFSYLGDCTNSSSFPRRIFSNYMGLGFKFYLSRIFRPVILFN